MEERKTDSNKSKKNILSEKPGIEWEYKNLRKEIMFNLERRLKIIAFSVAGTVALLGFALEKNNP